MNSNGIIRKIRALQSKTVQNGCTPEEADAAVATIARLEARLGYKVARAEEPRARLGLRGRIWRNQAMDSVREQERRKAEAMSHIIGLGA